MNKKNGIFYIVALLNAAAGLLKNLNGNNEDAIFFVLIAIFILLLGKYWE